jgi:hypothetical protein
MKLPYNDDLYETDYDHLGNIFSDALSAVKSVFTTVVEAGKPAIPALIYRQATGQEMPPAQVNVTQAPAQTPSWIMPAVVGIGGLALLAFLKSQQKRSYR